jgi:hypothetical protein
MVGFAVGVAVAVGVFVEVGVALAVGVDETDTIVSAIIGDVVRGKSVAGARLQAASTRARVIARRMWREEKRVILS